VPVRSSHSSHNFSDQLVQIVGCEAYPYCQVIVTILHIYYFLACDVPLERKAFTVGQESKYRSNRLQSWYFRCNFPGSPCISL